MRGTKIEVIGTLEHRLKAFIESVTQEKLWPPISLTGISFNSRDAFEALIMMRLSKPRFLRDHFTDGHHFQSCGTCGAFMNNYRYEYESKARSFIEVNRELLAELNLLH